MRKISSLLARHINNDGETSLVSGLGNELGGDELRDRLREVDAVDKDVDVENLLEWTALGRLCHVPLDNVVPAMISPAFSMRLNSALTPSDRPS